MKKNIIISIDDISPHDYSGMNAINNCMAVLKKYPNVKFVFFIPVAFKRTSGRVDIIARKDKPIVNIINKEPLYISKYKSFCKTLLSLPKENFQYGYHGYFHSKIDHPNRSNNNEFKYLTYQETINKIDLMENEVKKAGLETRFSKIFRPPGWTISNEAVKAFLDKGYTLHLNKKVDYDLTNVLSQKRYSKHKVFYCNYAPPEVPLKQSKNDTIHIVYHACEWLRNFFDIKQFNALTEFYMKEKYIINYKFLE